MREPDFIFGKTGQKKGKIYQITPQKSAALVKFPQL